MFDALDGKLTSARQSEFRQHAATCLSCGPMFADVEHGFNSLHLLEEIEPPQHLVHNIMAKTAFAHTGAAVRVPGAPPADSVWNRLRQGVLRPVLHPRFAMSLGMAVFSIAVTLNVAGVSRKDLTDLRPATAMVKFNELEGRIFKYYENLRAVYLFESFMRDIKQNQNEPEKTNNKDSKTKKENKETSHIAVPNHSVASLIRPSESQPYPAEIKMRTLA
ncbi:MAG: hypothetical protein JOZ43_00350 [Acidobacteriales bacterium]|nr:hypothetical protein [Terriglobales bacterium]